MGELPMGNFRPDGDLEDAPGKAGVDQKCVTP
jgi:hypothetical protein